MRTSGEGVVFEIRTHLDRGMGWFNNPRFWRTSFVDGPSQRYHCFGNFFDYSFECKLNSGMK